MTVYAIPFQSKVIFCMLFRTNNRLCGKEMPADCLYCISYTLDCFPKRNERQWGKELRVQIQLPYFLR